METREKIKMPNITANSSEQFAEIEGKLRELPRTILDQIDVAKNGLLGVDCNIKLEFSKDKIFLPNYTTQIQDFGDHIGVYCEPFFFNINKKDNHNKSFSYVLIDCKEYIDAGR